MHHCMYPPHIFQDFGIVAVSRVGLAALELDEDEESC